MSTITGRTPAHLASVVATHALTPRLRRITLAGPSLVGLVSQPAQDVELVLSDESGRRYKRRYTIRAARPALGELDIDALRHPHGPGGRWAASVQVGAPVEFLGPRGKLELRPAGWYLFIADEAGLPAVAALLEALFDSQAGRSRAEPLSRVIVLAEVGDESDEFALPGASVRWLHRGDRPPGSPELIAAALDELADQAELAGPAGPLSNQVGPADGGALGQAYLLGESRAVVALRPHVMALGLPSDRIFTKGYWNVGRVRA